MLKAIEVEQHPSSYNERNFLMCKSCFWCTSLRNSVYKTIKACPSCRNTGLELMPISVYETYTFNYDPKHGVSLQFGI
jgi:hypothetical protein